MTKIHITKTVPVVTCNLPNVTTYVFFPHDISHTRQDSLERIADELEDWSEDNRVNGYDEVSECAGDFAGRIRKLAKEVKGR